MNWLKPWAIRATDNVVAILRAEAGFGPVEDPDNDPWAHLTTQNPYSEDFAGPQSERQYEPLAGSNLDGYGDDASNYVRHSFWNSRNAAEGIEDFDNQEDADLDDLAPNVVQDDFDGDVNDLLTLDQAQHIGSTFPVVPRLPKEGSHLVSVWGYGDDEGSGNHPYSIEDDPRWATHPEAGEIQPTPGAVDAWNRQNPDLHAYDQKLRQGRS